MPAINFSRLPFLSLASLTGAYLLISLPDQKIVLSLAGVLPVALLFLPFLKKGRKPVLFFLAGFFWTGFICNQQLSVSLPQAMAGQEFVVDGIVDGLPVREGRVVRFNFRIIALKGGEGGKSSGKIRVSDYRKKSINPQPGEAWRLLLRLKPPHGFANRAGFNYEKWLFSQRVIATAYIRKNREKLKGLNRRLPEKDQPASIDRLRQRIAGGISRSLPGSPFRGFITALATGDRRDISTQQWSILQTTGTSHLMAISGLHVGLVAGIAFFLFRFLFTVIPRLPLFIPAHKIAAAASLLFVVFYSLLAGFTLPTQRALFMLTILMLAIIFQRRVRVLDILSLTLLLVLLIDPLSILSAGFWLSFSAVAMILYTLQTRRYGEGWRTGGFSKTVNLQWKLSLMMAPVTLLFFQQIPLTGPLANLVAIPVVAFIIVPLVLLASLVFLITGDGYIEQMFYHLADTVMGLLWSLLETLEILPESLSLSIEQSLVAVAGLVFSVMVFMLPSGLKLRRLAAVGLLVFLFPSRNKLAEGEFSMLLLDVGQGLSVIIMTAEHTLLFDTGARFSKGFNAADAVVLPVLQSLSVRQLDALIISHGDNDHQGGVSKVLDGIKVNQLISNETIKYPDITPCRAGLAWQWEGVRFRILHPDPKLTSTHQSNSVLKGNNASCVLHVQSAYGSVMLPADIEKQAEQEMLLRYSDSMQASVLVAGHHGSNTSSSHSFLNAVSPQLVLFPAGWMNRYHHPAEKVLDRLTDRKIHSLVTGECGAITVLFRSAEISISAYREENMKIWDTSLSDDRCRKIAIGLPETPAI